MKHSNILYQILDYSIANNSVSVVNADNGSVYFIPYDGLFFDEILLAAPQGFIELENAIAEEIDNLRFTLLCKFSHVGGDNRFYAQYELQLGNTVLARETVPMIPGMRAKPNTLLNSARKCARKIITQEKNALKNHMLKTMRTGREYDS